jgi:hypothetical protein
MSRWSLTSTPFVRSWTRGTEDGKGVRASGLFIAAIEGRPCVSDRHK